MKFINLTDYYEPKSAICLNVSEIALIRKINYPNFVPPATGTEIYLKGSNRIFVVTETFEFITDYLYKNR